MRSVRSKSVAGVAAALTLLTATVALADTVTNDVSTVGGVSLLTVAKGSSGTVAYTVNNTNANDSSYPDSNTPCNLAGSNTDLRITPSGFPAGVTANPTSAVASNCGAAVSIEFEVASSAVPGDYPIAHTLSKVQTHEGVYYNVADFTLRVVEPEGDACAAVLAPEAPSFTHSPNGSNGWYTTVPTVEASSGGATVTYSTSSGSGYGVAPILGQGETTVYAIATGPAPCSKVSAESSQLFKVDTQAPDVTLNGGPQDGATYDFGFVPAAPTCSAVDPTPGSGLTGSCLVSGYSRLVGSHRVTGSQSDVAGNEGSTTAGYEVSAWSIGNAGGFKSPVTSDPTKVNTVKAGSAVPLKFNVYTRDNGEVTDVSMLGAIWTWTKRTCELGDAEIPVDGEAGSTTLRYEDGQFIRNWKTSTTKGCGTLTLTLADGSTIAADFRLK